MSCRGDTQLFNSILDPRETPGRPPGPGMRLLAVAADMVMSPFGKRSQLYERLQSGELDRMRQRLFSQYKDPRPAERMMRFVKDLGDGGRF